MKALQNEADFIAATNDSGKQERSSKEGEAAALCGIKDESPEKDLVGTKEGLEGAKEGLEVGNKEEPLERRKKCGGGGSCASTSAALNSAWPSPNTGNDIRAKLQGKTSLDKTKM